MAAGDLYTGITVQGLYNEQTGDALYGVLGSPAPASALYLAGTDGTNLRGLSVTSNGFLNVNATITPPSDNIATGTLTNPGDTVTVSTAGTSALMVQITGAAITAGNIDFQVSLDGTTWQAAKLYPVFPDGTPSATSTNVSPSNWTLFVGGVQKFRVLADGTYAGGPSAIVLTAGQGQYSVEVVSPVAANFLATATQGTTPWVENLTQVGGSAITLGAKTSANSFPVVIASDQAAYPVNIQASGTALTATGSSLNTNVTNTVTVTGTVAVTQSTSPWIVAGNKTSNAGAPNGTNVGVLPAEATAAAPTYTEGNLVLLSTDLAGNLRTTTTISGTIAVAGTLSNNTAAPAANNVGVLAGLAATSYTTNTYTTGNQVIPVTDLHGALNEDLQAWAGTALGTPTNFGTTPTAVIAGSVNASIFQGAAAIAVANPLFTEISDGTSAMGTMANFGTNPGAVKSLNTNSFIYNTSAIPAFVVGTLTNNNAAPAANNVGVLPALIEAGAFPATTLPALTAGDQALVSITQGGSLRVIPVDEANAPSISYYSADMGDTEKSIANPAILPMLSIRTNSASIQFLMRGFTLQSNGTLSRWQLVKNATLTGATFATSNGNMQIDTAATVSSGGTVVDSGYFSGTQVVKAVLYAMAAGAPGDRFTLVGSSISGTSKISASMQWSELAAAI